MGLAVSWGWNGMRWCGRLTGGVGGRLLRGGEVWVVAGGGVRLWLRWSGGGAL